MGGPRLLSGQQVTAGHGTIPGWKIPGTLSFNQHKQQIVDKKQFKSDVWIAQQVFLLQRAYSEQDTMLTSWNFCLEDIIMVDMLA